MNVSGEEESIKNKPNQPPQKQITNILVGEKSLGDKYTLIYNLLQDNKEDTTLVEYAFCEACLHGMRYIVNRIMRWHSQTIWEVERDSTSCKKWIVLSTPAILNGLIVAIENNHQEIVEYLTSYEACGIHIFRLNAIRIEDEAETDYEGIPTYDNSKCVDPKNKIRFNGKEVLEQVKQAHLNSALAVLTGGDMVLFKEKFRLFCRNNTISIESCYKILKTFFDIDITIEEIIIFIQEFAISIFRKMGYDLYIGAVTYCLDNKITTRLAQILHLQKGTWTEREVILRFYQCNFDKSMQAIFHLVFPDIIWEIGNEYGIMHTIIREDYTGQYGIRCEDHHFYKTFCCQECSRTFETGDQPQIDSCSSSTNSSERVLQEFQRPVTCTECTICVYCANYEDDLDTYRKPDNCECVKCRRCKWLPIKFKCEECTITFNCDGCGETHNTWLEYEYITPDDVSYYVKKCRECMKKLLAMRKCCLCWEDIKNWEFHKFKICNHDNLCSNCYNNHYKSCPTCEITAENHCCICIEDKLLYKFPIVSPWKCEHRCICKICHEKNPHLAKHPCPTCRTVTK